MILERIQGTRFSRVLPEWSGYTAVLIAGGPSLTFDQVAAVRLAREVDRVRVIAINDAYLIAPWADVAFAADKKWHDWHTAGIDKPKLGLIASEVRNRWKAYMGQKCTVEPTAPYVPDAVHAVKIKYGFGLSLESDRLVTGKHGGFQALNISVLAGCKTVILLGYDAKESIDGDRHWHGNHPVETERKDDIYAEMRRAFSAAENPLKEAGVRVLNCSRYSAIESFPKVDLEDALDGVIA